MGIQMRPKDTNLPYYNPERDLLAIWPSTLMKGAAYAADRRSSINKWLLREVPEDQVHGRIRCQLQRLVIALKTGKSANLEEILAQEMIDWPVFQAIMFAVGILLFKQYNKFYKGSRMTDMHGGVQDPVGQLDELGIMRAFDELVEKSKLIV